MQDTEAATLTPRELLDWAIRDVREQQASGIVDYSVEVLADAAEQMTTWIRENRGRLHRPTCMDGNGCRCGLGDLPMWGAAG